MPFANYKSKGASKWESSSSLPTNTYSTDNVQRSIDNARLRITDSGYESNPDSRNWFEKLTNLPQNQNAFFDVLELLGRPGQAILNTIDKAPKGRLSVGESALRGFTGKDTVRGSELAAQKFGEENKAANFVLGTGLEILTDPLNLVPGGAIVKGAKAVSNPIKTGVKSGYNALENVSPALRGFRENVVQPTTQKVRDGFGFAFNRDYKIDETLDGGKSDRLRDLAEETENTRRFMQEEAAKNIGNVAKSTGLDAGTDVGRLMEKDLKQFEEVEVPTKPSTVDLNWTNDAKKIAKDKEFNSVQINADASLHKVPSSLGEQFDAHGIAKGSLDNQLDNLVDLLNKGIDPNKPFHTAPYYTENTAVMGLGGASDGAYKSGSFIVISGKGKTLKNDGIESVIVNDAFYESIPQLEKTFPNVNFVRADEVPKVLPNVKPKASTTKVEKEISRPVREMPSDPKVQEAARTLVRSNQALREYALSNGIQISEIEGYMTHILSQEERAARNKGKVLPIDRGSFGTGQPNKKILNQRELKGSVEDINEQVGRNFFEPNAYFATAIGQKRLIDYIQAASFRKQVLQDTNFSIPYEKGMDIPPNAVVIDSNNYTFLKEGQELEGVTETVGGQYIVTKQAKQLLDRYKSLTTDEGTKAFLNAFDRVQSTWKRMALFSLPYHLRNDVGAKFNNWIGGMNAADLVKYSAESDVEVFNAIIRGDESDLYREFRQQGLGSTGLSQVEFAIRGEEPEKAIQRTVESMSKDTKGKVLDRLNPLRAFETSREFGDFIDQTNRFALYKWAKDKGMSPQDAARKVKEVQFDYTKLSPLEQNVLARVVPFYRWMRNNIPFQIKQFIEDPRKYSNLNKARLNAQESVGIDEENVPDWMKESFAVPVSDDKFIGLNLPLGDLTRLSKPGKTFVDSISPLLKLPMELSLNRNFFYNKPIEKFEGQEKQFQLGNTEFGIPSKMAYAGEQLTGQIGRGFSSYLQKPEDVDQDTKFRMPSLGISSVLKDYDAEQAQYFQKLNELMKLQDFIDMIEQQTGTRPRTVNEIK